MTRAITFPRQASGDYVNRETGVMIQRYGNGWRAFRPAMTSTGYVGLCTAVRNLSVARQVALRHVEDVARPAVDQAHAEALVEYAYRAELRGELARWATGAAPYPYVRVNDGEPETRVVEINQAHAEALRLNPDFRKGEHFETRGRTYRVVDVQPAGANRAAVALAVVGKTNTSTSVYADVLIDWAHAEANAMNEARGAAPSAAVAHQGACGAAGARLGAFLDGSLIGFPRAYESDEHFRSRMTGVFAGLPIEFLLTCIDHPDRPAADCTECVPENDEPMRSGTTGAAKAGEADAVLSHILHGRTDARIVDVQESTFVDGAPVITFENGDQTYGPYGLGPADAQARTDAARIIAGARAHAVVRATSWHIGGEMTEPRPGDIVRIARGGRQADVSGDVREMQWKVVEFAADRNRVRVDLVRGSLLGPQWEDWCDVELVSRPGAVKCAHGFWVAGDVESCPDGCKTPAARPGRATGLPPVPADSGDDAAWAAYCAALPAPTEAELQVTAAEFTSPYLPLRAESLDRFRRAVADIRRQRERLADGWIDRETFDDLYKIYRETMRGSARTVRETTAMHAEWVQRPRYLP